MSTIGAGAGAAWHRVGEAWRRRSTKLSLMSLGDGIFHFVRDIGSVCIVFLFETVFSDIWSGETLDEMEVLEINNWS